jgi:hypothetical protein
VGLLVAGPTLPQRADEGADEGSEEWVRITHPLLPISFELPRGTEFWIAPAFSLAQLRSRDGRRKDVLLFGIRSLGEDVRRRHAVEIAFYWLTPEVRGVDLDQLSHLHDGTREPQTALEFLRGVLYSDLPQVRLRDVGPGSIVGQPARRIGIAWRTLVGTPHERELRGEAVLVPAHPAAAILIVGRFDPESRETERRELFPRIVTSLRLEEALQL